MNAIPDSTFDGIDAQSQKLLRTLEQMFPEVPFLSIGSLAWEHHVDLKGFTIHPGDVDLCTSVDHFEEVQKILDQSGYTYNLEEGVPESKGTKHLRLNDSNFSSTPVSIFLYPKNNGLVAVDHLPESGIQIANIKEVIQSYVRLIFVELSEEDPIEDVQKRIRKVYMALAENVNINPPLEASSVERVCTWVTDEIEGLLTEHEIYKEYYTKARKERILAEIRKPDFIASCVIYITQAPNTDLVREATVDIPDTWNTVTGNIQNIVAAVPELTPVLAEEADLQVIKEARFIEVCQALKNITQHDGTEKNPYHNSYAHGEDVSNATKAIAQENNCLNNDDTEQVFMLASLCHDIFHTGSTKDDWENNITKALRATAFILQSLDVPKQMMVAVLGCIAASTSTSGKGIVTNGIEWAFKFSDIFNKRATLKDSLKLSIANLAEMPEEDRPDSLREFVESEIGFRKNFLLVAMREGYNRGTDCIQVPLSWIERLEDDIEELPTFFNNHPQEKKQVQGLLKV